MHILLDFTQVTVKAKIDESPNTIFHFQCPGNSSHSHTLLLYKDGQVNREIAEVCREQFVTVAFNQYPGYIEVDTETNTMVEYSTPTYEGEVIPAWTWEILSSFFAINKLTPIFNDCNYTWGWLDEDTGLWNGAVAMVDLHAFVLISITICRSRTMRQILVLHPLHAVMLEVLL